MREELSLKIAILSEKFAPDLSWYGILGKAVSCIELWLGDFVLHFLFAEPISRDAFFFLLCLYSYGFRKILKCLFFLYGVTCIYIYT